MHITEEKALLRQKIESLIAAINPAKREQESEEICSELLAQIPKDAVVCAYMPLPTEVDLRPLLTNMLKRSQALYLPRYEDGNVVFSRITDLDALTEGRFNIPEPQQDAQVLEDDKADIVLVPGRAFDQHGNRLGRGGGGYDKWIAAQRNVSPDTQFLGVAFKCQIVDEVPIEPHDQKVDTVVSCGHESPNPSQTS